MSSTLHPRALLQLVARKTGFRPNAGTSETAPQQGLFYGIDRFIWLNGFGAFVSGWMISPRRRVRSLSLLLAGRVLEADRRFLVAKARPDLWGSFSAYADAIATAGFDGLFRGEGRRHGVGKPLLRVLMDDGTSIDLVIPESTIRLCDNLEVLTMLGWALPSLAHEPFLDTFVDAFADTIKRRASQVVPVVAVKARSVVLLVLPPDWHDLFLVMADIRRCVGALPTDVGIVFLMTARHARVQVLDRVHHLGLATGHPVGLFEIKDSSYALWSLSPVLAKLETERFWFCGPNVLPTQEGWRIAASYFTDGRSGCEFFLHAHHKGPGSEPESLSFAWGSGPFRAWATSAPFSLGGFHRDNRLPAKPGAGRNGDAIDILRTNVAVEPIRRADERLRAVTSARHDTETSP